MGSDSVLEIRGVGKDFKVFRGRGARIAEAASLGRRKFHSVKRALDRVDLEVAPGESIGIVGVNGSGKSTLLQIVCGTMPPSRGEILLRGKISALLELGAGFSPDFTGRENAGISMTIAGVPADELDERIAEAVEFSGIGDYADQPVRSYSSGMYVRMAFASAIMTKPDILIVDEALSVGDAAFQMKCFRHVDRMRSEGASLILVSHDLEAVRTMTERALLLDRGIQVAVGSSADIVREYRNRENLHVVKGFSPARETAPEPGRAAELLDVAFIAADGREVANALSGQDVIVRTRYRCREELDHLNVGFRLRGPNGVKVYSWGTLNQDMALIASSGGTEGTFWSRVHGADSEWEVDIRLPDLRLGDGTYELEAMLTREHLPNYKGQEVLHWVQAAAFLKVGTDWAENGFGGIVDMRAVAGLPVRVRHDRAIGTGS